MLTPSLFPPPFPSHPLCATSNSHKGARLYPPGLPIPLETPDQDPSIPAPDQGNPNGRGQQQQQKKKRNKAHKAREEYWTQYGFSTLPLESLVYVVGPHFPPLLATVSRRDITELAFEAGPVVGLAFSDDSSASGLLLQMGRDLRGDGVFVVSLASNLFAYR